VHVPTVAERALLPTCTRGCAWPSFWRPSDQGNPRARGAPRALSLACGQRVMVATAFGGWSARRFIRYTEFADSGCIGHVQISDPLAATFNPSGLALRSASLSVRKTAASGLHGFLHLEAQLGLWVVWPFAIGSCQTFKRGVDRFLVRRRHGAPACRRHLCAESQRREHRHKVR